MDPQKYPAAVGYIVNVIMAAVVAFNFLPQSTAHAVAVAVVALTSLVVAFLVHPFVVGAATGAFQTLLVAVTAFGFHLTDEQTAGAVGLFGLIAAFITHRLVIPTVARRAGAWSVDELEGRPPSVAATR